MKSVLEALDTNNKSFFLQSYELNMKDRTNHHSSQAFDSAVMNNIETIQKSFVVGGHSQVVIPGNQNKHNDAQSYVHYTLGISNLHSIVMFLSLVGLFASLAVVFVAVLVLDNENNKSSWQSYFLRIPDNASREDILLWYNRKQSN